MQTDDQTAAHHVRVGEAAHHMRVGEAQMGGLPTPDRRPLFLLVLQLTRLTAAVLRSGELRSGTGDRWQRSTARPLTLCQGPAGGGSSHRGWQRHDLPQRLHNLWESLSWIRRKIRRKGHR